MKLTVLLLAVLLTVMSGGCSSPLRGEDVPVHRDGISNSGEDESTLIKDPGLVLYNMPGGIFDLEEGTFTTPETFGRSPVEGEENTDPDEETRGKYILKGPVIGTSKLDSGGFTDVQFVYFNEPQEGEFTFRARILMTEKAGDSTSKGFFFGAVMGTAEGDQVKFEGGSRGAGILYRTNDTADGNTGGPSMRPYFTEAGGGWSTGPTQSSDAGSARPEYWMNLRQPGWRQERIVEVVRQSEERRATDGSDRIVAFIFRVYDSKSGALLREVFLDEASTLPGLRKGQPVYLVLALLGTSAQFSDITIWNTRDKTGEPLVQTPATKPAYVGVERFTLRARLGTSSQDRQLGVYSGLPGTSSLTVARLFVNNAGGYITLIPNFQPAYADNDYFDWEIIEIEDFVPSGIILEKVDGSPETGWKRAYARVDEAGGKAIIMATSRDPGLADWSLAITVQ
jgi:hypothetical protein